MMKLYHKILFHAASVSWILAGQTSCQDINGNYDRIVPEDYYTVISLKETGVKEVAMSVADRQYDCEVPVLKGGLHVDAVADVVLETPGQKWVDENYNEKQGTAYKVITPSMYSVADYHVRIPSGESGKSAHVILDAEKIYAAMQLPENAGSTLVLPVRIASASDKVNEDKDVVILRCSVSPDKVYFMFDVLDSNISVNDYVTILAAAPDAVSLSAPAVRITASVGGLRSVETYSGSGWSEAADADVVVKTAIDGTTSTAKDEDNGYLIEIAIAKSLLPVDSGEIKADFSLFDMSAGEDSVQPAGDPSVWPKVRGL